jgi:hypothetical protein
MPVEAKPLFRPDVLRAHLAAFSLPGRVDAQRPKLAHWVDLLSSGKANTLKEQEILPDFLTDFFCGLLGYTRPADGGPRWAILNSGARTRRPNATCVQQRGQMTPD